MFQPSQPQSSLTNQSTPVPAESNGPTATQVELQKLLLQSSKLSAQLSSLSTFPVVHRSPSVLAGRMESLARKSKPSDTQYASIVESVKADARIRHLMDCVEQRERQKSVAGVERVKERDGEAVDSIDKLINLKRAEMEAVKRKEEEEKRREELRAMINMNKVPHFVAAMNKFNEARLRKSGGKFAIFELFGECSREAQNDIRLEQLLDCWNALAVLTGESENGQSDEDVFSAAPSILKAPTDPWPILVAKRSRKVLEMSYLKFIDRTLSQNPRETVLGGKPTMLDRVRAFCAIRAKRLPPAEIEKIEVSNGVAPWMIIFYLLRCGLFKDIQEQLANNSYYQRTDPVLTSFLKTFIDAPQQAMSLQSRAQVQAEFNQRQLQGPQDPFKMALLKIIGRCDLHKKTIPDLLQSSEDYLWLQLWLIKEDDAASPSTFTLSDLQKTICDFGAAYFSGSTNGRPGNPLNYFQMLVLTGQFERAVNSLLMSGYHLEAVHVAIGCLYHNRLKIGNDEEAMVGIKNIICQLLPVLRVSLDKTGELQYILCLSLHDSLLSEAQSMVRQLVTADGSDLVQLLGDVLSDGRQQDGLVKHFAPLLRLQNEQDFIKTIVVGSAERCVEERRVVEALQLYNLCGQYDKVLSVLNKELAAAFVKPFNKEQWSQLTSMAQSIIDYYEQQPVIQSVLTQNSQLQVSTLLLLRVLNVKQLCEEGEWERALSSVELLDLIPMTPDISVLQSAADRLSTQTTQTASTDQISTIRSDLLLLTMSILFHCYKRLRSTVIIDSGRQSQIDGLRQRAKSLLVLVGLLQGRVRVESAAEMARMEVMMV